MAIQSAVGPASSSRAVRGAQPPADVIANWSRIVRGAYLDTPSLRLTQSQVQRLWDLDTVSCEHVLNALTELRFLESGPDGGFVRADGGRR